MPAYRTSALSEFALQSIIDQVIAETDREGLAGLALMGSYASGTATAYSDVDLVCFRTEESGAEHIRCLDHTYVVISEVALPKIDTWFTKPELATEFVGGLYSMRPVFDPRHFFARSAGTRTQLYMDPGPGEKGHYIHDPGIDRIG